MEVNNDNPVCIHSLIELIKKMRFDITNEKDVQAQLEQKLIEKKYEFERECILDEDKKNIPDFMVGNICIEVKIKGGALDIFRQLQRYTGFDRVETIILLTNRNIVLPSKINDKNAYQINIGAGWL